VTLELGAFEVVDLVGKMTLKGLAAMRSGLILGKIDS
jgi:hypothetical protein